jgi:hypothetical protein
MGRFAGVRQREQQMARFDSRGAEAGTAALIAGRGGLAARGRWSRVITLVGIFLLWWLLTAAVYRNTASNFLRAESGWFLFLSHSSPAVQQGFKKALLTKNFWGHYTPFAFLAEFETAKVVGTNGAFWKWRQITLLALLATTLFLLVRRSGAAMGLPRVQTIFSAGALTAVLVLQIQMRDFIAWPFMIMQLFWLLFSLCALMSLVRMAQCPAETKWPWFAAAAAYASLHFLGLGLATVGATAAAMIGIYLVRRRGLPSQAARITTPLLSLVAITTLHAIAMQRFMRAEPIPSSAGWKPGSFLMESLGFIPNLALAALRGLFSTTQLKPEAGQIGQHWPYGLAILLGAALLVSAALFRAVREPSVRNETRFVLRSFASVLFLTIIALISIRQWIEPSPNGFADYLGGPRHLVPASFALIGIMTELFLLVALLPVLPSGILSLGLGIGAVVGHLQFAAHIYPKVSAKSMISHQRAWHSIVTMTRECQTAGLAIPNIPLGELTQEFADWDLKLFEPLLRSDLKMPPETNLQIAPWIEFAHGSPDNYSRQVPSLAEVRKRLNLNETTQ